MDARAAASMLLAWLGACTFDASGAGASSGAQPGDDASSSSGAEPEATTDPGSGDADADATSGADDASPSSSGPGDDGDDGDDTTGSPGACEGPPPFTMEFYATQALLEDPMQLGTSPTEGTYAYSEVAGHGRASFEFVLPCEVEVRAWARVYDPGVGTDGLDPAEPDSFLVAFDGEDPVQWWYGCQMLDAAPFGGAWSWEPLMDNAYCGTDEYRRTLSPGTHLLHLTNREAGNHAMSRMAAVAHVVVTSDPAYAPPS